MERLAGGKTEETILRFVEGISFPAHKDDIIHAARKNGAPNDIVSVLQQMPANEFADEQALLALYPRLDQIYGANGRCQPAGASRNQSADIGRAPCSNLGRCRRRSATLSLHLSQSAICAANYRTLQQGLTLEGRTLRLRVRYYTLPSTQEVILSRSDIHSEKAISMHSR